VSPFRARALIVAALVALSGRAVSAQDPDPVRLTVDLGFVSTSGNTEVTTFNMGEKLTYTTGRWLFGQAVGAIYGQTDGSSTAEQDDAALRAEYSLGPHFLSFAGATWYRNTFAGLTSRFVEGVGLGWRTIQAARDTLRLDAAITSNQETNLALVQSTFAASRASLAYKHLFGASTAFTELLEWVTSLEDTEDQRLFSETALTAPISKQVALKATYVIRFDNQPEPGFKDTDRVFTTGLQIVF